jgi:hypothetical protein
LRNFVRQFSRRVMVRSGERAAQEHVLRETDIYQFAQMANVPEFDAFRAKMARVAEALRTQGYYVEPSAAIDPVLPGGDPVEAQLLMMLDIHRQQRQDRARLEALEASTRREIEAVAAEAREAKQIAIGEDGFMTLSEFCARKGYRSVSKEVLKAEGSALRARLDSQGRRHLYHPVKRDPGAHNSHPARPWSVVMLESEWWPSFARRMKFVG